MTNKRKVRAPPGTCGRPPPLVVLRDGGVCRICSVRGCCACVCSVRCGVSRQVGGQSYLLSRFGGVILVKADRTDITRVKVRLVPTP
jgi:hypothetical protein